MAGTADKAVKRTQIKILVPPCERDVDLSLTIDEGWNSGEFRSLSVEGDDAGDSNGLSDDSIAEGI